MSNRFPIVSLFFSINLRKIVISLCKNKCSIPEKRSYSKPSNAERIVKIFRLGAEIQLFVHNNGITIEISKLIVGYIQRFVLGRKVTLRTLWTYEHHLRTICMESHPDPKGVRI